METKKLAMTMITIISLVLMLTLFTACGAEEVEDNTMMEETEPTGEDTTVGNIEDIPLPPTPPTPPGDIAE